MLNVLKKQRNAFVYSGLRGGRRMGVLRVFLRRCAQLMDGFVVEHFQNFERLINDLLALMQQNPLAQREVVQHALPAGQQLDLGN